MLGDIVSNSSRPTAGATAVKPVGSPTSSAGGYGVSSFGDRPAPRPMQPRPQAQPARPQPIAQASAAVPSVAPAAPAQVTAEQPAVTPTPITALPPVKTKKASKIPLILTIVGIVVFIGGVAGLFIYALGGK